MRSFDKVPDPQMPDPRKVKDGIVGCSHLQRSQACGSRDAPGMTLTMTEQTLTTELVSALSKQRQNGFNGSP